MFVGYVHACEKYGKSDAWRQAQVERRIQEHMPKETSRRSSRPHGFERSVEERLLFEIKIVRELIIVNSPINANVEPAALDDYVCVL